MSISGETSLMTAAQMGDIESVRILLEYGANIKAKNEEGKLHTIINTKDKSGKLH